SEDILSASMARVNSFPSPKICFCPTYSSRESGRMRALKGESAGINFSSEENKLVDMESLCHYNKKIPASAVESGVNENHHSQVGASVRPPKARQQVTGSRSIVLWFNTSEILSHSA